MADHRMGEPVDGRDRLAAELDGAEAALAAWGARADAAHLVEARAAFRRARALLATCDAAPAVLAACADRVHAAHAALLVDAAAVDLRLAAAVRAPVARAADVPEARRGAPAAAAWRRPHASWPVPARPPAPAPPPIVTRPADLPPAPDDLLPDWEILPAS